MKKPKKARRKTGILTALRSRYGGNKPKTQKIKRKGKK